MTASSTGPDTEPLGYDPVECGDLDGFRETGLPSFRRHHPLQMRMKPVFEDFSETFASLGILPGCTCGVQKATMAQRTPLHVLMEIAQRLAHLGAGADCAPCMCDGLSLMFLAWMRASECEERRSWADSVLGCCECIGLSQLSLYGVGGIINRSPVSACTSGCWAKALSDSGDLSIGEALYVNRARRLAHPSGTTSLRLWLAKLTEPYVDQLFGSCDQIPFHGSRGLIGFYTIVCSHTLTEGAEEVLRELLRYTMDSEMFSQYGFKSSRSLHSRTAVLPDVEAAASTRADGTRPALRETRNSYTAYVSKRLVDGIWTPFFYQLMSAPMVSYHRTQVESPRPIESLSVLIFDLFTHRRRLLEDGNVDATTFIDSLEGLSASGAYSKWHALMCATSYQAVMSYLWDLTHHLPPPSTNGEVSGSV